MITLFLGRRACLVFDPRWPGLRGLLDGYRWGRCGSRWPTYYVGVGKLVTGPGKPGRLGVEVSG